MDKPNKIKLNKLFLENNFKDLINTLKNSDWIQFKEDIKIYEDCITTNESNTPKLDKIQKSIIQTTFFFLVFIVVYIYIERIGITGLKKQVIDELRDIWKKWINSEEMDENVKIISKKIIYQNWWDSIQKEKKSDTHKNVTKNCKNDSYIIKYNEDKIDFNFRIGLCIMKENEIQIWKSAKKS